MGEIGQGPAEGWTDQGQPRPKQGSTSDSTSRSTWKVDVEGRCGSSVGKLGLECRLANSAWKVDLARGMVVARLGLPRPPVLGQLPARSRRALLGDGSPCLATAAGAGTNEKSPKVNKQLAHRTAILMMLALGLVLLVLLGVCAEPPHQSHQTRPASQQGEIAWRLLLSFWKLAKGWWFEDKVRSGRLGPWLGHGPPWSAMAARAWPVAS